MGQSMVRTPSINPEKHLRKGERIYYHYEDLEEYHAGMWRIIRGSDRREIVDRAADLMKNSHEFKDAMEQAVKTWPKSCEHNLSAPSVNHIAWLGHAGCCVAVSSPEDCTRQAWGNLNSAEQDEANAVAAEVLATWMAPFKARKNVQK